MLLTMIMSLFSSILIGLAPCNSNCAALEQENTIEIKQRENLVSNNGYSVIGITDILQVGVFDSLFNSTDDFLSQNSVGRTFSFFSLTNDVRFVNYAYAYYYSGHDDFGYSTNGITLTNFNFVCNEYHEHPTNPLKWLDYTMNINSSTYNVSIDFTIFCNNSSTSTQPLWIDVNEFSHNVGNPYCLVMNNSSTLYKAFEDTSYVAFNNGYDSGYSTGYDEGYDNGVERGKEIASDSASDIYQATFNAGKQVGDSEGYQRAISQGSTAATIFSGIVTVGLLPVNVLLTMFQYEVFGINIAGLVSGLFTIAVVIIIIRLVTGKKND